jgi:excisionase family DNA binding protein
MRTVRETSQRLALSVSSTYELIRSGSLPHYRIGGAIRIADADIERFLAGCRRERQPVQVVRKLRPRLKHIKL